MLAARRGEPTACDSVVGEAGSKPMIRMLVGAVVGYAVFRIGLRIVDENRAGRRKVLPAPPDDVGVDVSMKE